MPLDWRGEEAAREVEANVWEGLVRATEFAQGRLQDALNVPNPTAQVRQRTRNTAAGKKGSQYTVYRHGAPRGGPPWKRTGNLQQNVARDYDRPQLKSRLGVRLNAVYGVYLEVGGWPWLWATILRFQQQIAAQFALVSGAGEGLNFERRQ